MLHVCALANSFFDRFSPNSYMQSFLISRTSQLSSVPITRDIEILFFIYWQGCNIYVLIKKNVKFKKSCLDAFQQIHSVADSHQISHIIYISSCLNLNPNYFGKYHVIWSPRPIICGKQEYQSTIYWISKYLNVPFFS